MTNNMFNMFDPMNKSLNPMMMYMILAMMMMKKMNKSTKTSSIFKKLKSSLHTMMKENSKKKMKTMNMVMMNTFLLILMMNLMAMIQFSWSQTAQMSFNFPLIAMVYTCVIFKSTKAKKKFLIHMTPSGTPNMLIPFMIMIEMISWAIRPITLITRLTANITSGHILMSMINKTITSMKPTMAAMMMMPTTSLIMLEMAVALIQAYIVMILISLYMKET